MATSAILILKHSGWKKLQGTFGLNPRPGKKWQVCPIKKWEETFSPKELGISPLAAQILLNRGICNPDDARRFLSPTLSDLPDPFTMKDMDKTVRRIAEALRKGDKITLFGDYDVDGTTATALLYLFLKN